MARARYERPVERLSVVYTPLPDATADLMQTYGVTVEQGWISPDVRWLLDGEAGVADVSRTVSKRLFCCP
jgi:hypothetical protein